jgi:uroporphyrinogen-III synthase
MTERIRASFEGRRVLTLEARRSPELALMVVNYGGEPIMAPALCERPLDHHTEALAFIEGLMRDEFEMVVLMTGVGTRELVSIAEHFVPRATFIQLLARTSLVARGPKPMAALRELGLAAWAVAPSPNTWREVMTAIDARAAGQSLDGMRIAVQEYGVPNPDLTAALGARGGIVTSVPIYKWTLPDDIEPLRAGIRAIVDDQVDVLLLTAGVQMVHLLSVATSMGIEDEVRHHLQRLVIASIGPIASEELRRQGLPIDMEPSHPKMGFLVKEVAERCGPILEAKQSVQ